MAADHFSESESDPDLFGTRFQVRKFRRSSQEARSLSQDDEISPHLKDPHPRSGSVTAGCGIVGESAAGPPGGPTLGNVLGDHNTTLTAGGTPSSSWDLKK